MLAEDKMKMKTKMKIEISVSQEVIEMLRYLAGEDEVTPEDFLAQLLKEENDRRQTALSRKSYFFQL